MILCIGSNAIIVTLTHKIIVFVIHGRLLRNEFSVLLRDFGDIKFIAKCSRQRHISSCCKRSNPSHRMIRTVRYVCAHSGQWIDQRRTLLDLQSFDRIGIIGAPDLRAVI